MPKMQYLHDELTWEKGVENKKVLFSEINRGTFFEKKFKNSKNDP